MFPPKASRESKNVEARFKAQAERAYERYKVAKEIEETQKLKEIVMKKTEVEDFSDAMGMYIIDTSKEQKEAESEISSFTMMAATSKGGVFRCFKNLYADRKFELKWREFMCITFCLQVPFSYMLRHISMVYRWGALLVLIVYVIISGCIAMPVYMLLMFLGNYSRRSYIRFWECVPLLKGVAYSVAITTVLQELFNVAFGGLCLEYLIEVLKSSKYPWSECSFPKASPDCKYKPDKEGYNASCCSKHEQNCSNEQWRAHVFKFAAYDYFKSNQLRIGYDDVSNTSIPSNFLLMVSINWIMIFVMMLIGLRRFRGFMTAINLIVSVLVFVPFLLLTLYHTNYIMLKDLESNYRNIFNYKFWLEVSVHSLHRELAGDVITFSAISSPGISTTVDTVCIYTLKFMFLMLITVWVSIGVTMLQKYYHIVNTKCIYIDGFMVLYSLFPEILSKLPCAKLTLILYFVIMFYWCFSATVYTLNSFIGALLEEFPSLVRLKLLICCAFCLIVGGVNLAVMRPDLEILYERWISQNYIQMKVVLLFFTLIGIYLYTLDRLSNDYHFSYGQKLNVFWIHGVKIAMLLIAVLTLSRVILTYQLSKIEDIVITILILLPILGGAAVVFVRYQSGLKKTVINPDPRWGPPNYKKKIARNRFDPKRELRYRSAIQKCKHTCLLNSTSLQREIKYWKNKRLSQYFVEVE